MKILKQFIKCNIALSSMEKILFILGKLKYLESLVTLAWKKWDENLKSFNAFKLEKTLAIHKICINKSHKSNNLHILVEVNNHVVERVGWYGNIFVYRGTKMVCEVRIMHMVVGSKSYKIDLSVAFHHKYNISWCNNENHAKFVHS